MIPRKGRDSLVYKSLKNLFIVLFLLIVGCSNQERIITVTDSKTKQEAENILDLKPGMIVFKNRSDSMDRGNHDYQYIPVVIDLDFYQSNSIFRGDVVLIKSLYYIEGKSPLENPDGFDIARVVGLPGEKIKIEKGQIYINGGRLDTFYGKAHRLGRDLDELKRILENGKLAPHEQQNIKNNIETFEKDREQEEVFIPENQIFLVGERTDYFGLISSDAIAGKIIGYKK